MTTKINFQFAVTATSFKIRLTLIIAFLACCKMSYGQDPVLPSMNLGLTNIKDAVSPPPGLYYNNYTQIFATRSNYGAAGEKLAGDLKVDYLLSAHQLVYLSPIRLLNGNVHFMALLPLVKITASNGQQAGPSVNQSLLGDLNVGTGIQWSDKKLFNHSFWHRAEINFNLPSGAYNSAYNINPSGHLYAVGMYYTFTYFMAPRFSFGSRNQINYNFAQQGSEVKSGMYYNGNYSIEYNPVSTFHFALAGYYLKQLGQDAENGNRHFYQDRDGVTDTREQVLGLGPSLSYVTPGGVFIEAKVFFESGARNRAEGTRPTLHIALPLK